MHELTIVKDIFDTLDAHYGARARDIQKVQITTGLLCNVQPVLIQNAFDAFIAENKTNKEIDLEVIVNDIVAHCENCHRDFEVKYHRFICPYCGSPSHKIVQGDELYISEVVLIK